jgi:hypothetical protein
MAQTSNSDIAAANRLEPTASPSNNEQIQPDTPLTSPSQAPINQTQANNPDSVQQAQTASSAMANTATPPTPSQVNAQQQAAAAKPPAPMTPASIHGSIYKNVFGILAGGSMRPQIGPDGKPVTDANGKVVMQQASVKTLGASILAGAVSALVAGMSTPTQYQTLPGGRVIADNSGAFAAGAQAGAKQTQAGTQATAQAQADADQARAFATTDHNLKTVAANLTNLKMQGEVMDDAVDTASSVIQGMQNEQDSGEAVDDKGQPIDLIKKQNVSEEEMQSMLKTGDLHVTRDMVFPDGKHLVTDADGNQKYVFTYTIFDPKGMIRMTDALRENPAFKDKLQHVPNGQSVPVSVLAKYATEQNVLGSAVQGSSDQMKEYNAASGGKSDYSLTNAIKDHQIIRSILPEIGKYAHLPLDIALDKMSNDPALKDKTPAFNAYYASLGVTREGLQAMTDKRVADAKAEVKGQGAKPVTPELVTGARHDIAVTNPNLSAAQVDSYVRRLGPRPTYDEYTKVMDDAAKNSDRVTNQKLATQKLSDQEQQELFNYGRIGDKKLDLTNASEEMLVDQHTGQPIPWKALNKLAPTPQEIQRADFSDTVLKTAETLQKMKDAGQLPNGPLSGVTAQMLAAHGMSTQDAAKALAAIGFMQTAATGAHVGGRFSVPVLEKMSKLIGLNMNDSQFIGAMNEITDVMQHYKDKGGRISVGEWLDMTPDERKRMMGATSLAGSNAGMHQTNTPNKPANVVPPGKFPGKDAQGNIVGYADDAKGTNYKPFSK